MTPAGSRPRYFSQSTSLTLNQRDSGGLCPDQGRFGLNDIPNLGAARERDQTEVPAYVEQGASESDQRHALALLEHGSQSKRISCPSPGCTATFTQRKSLNRHRNTVRSVGAHVCPHPQCRETFKRRDIFLRHVLEQHQGEREMRDCPLCGKQLRPRTLRLHLGKKACRAAAGISSADVLAAPVEVIRLGIELFVRFQPWGKNHHYLDWHPRPKAHIDMSNEVKELEMLLYRQLTIALCSKNVKQDSSIVDALSIITVFTCQTRGWEASMVHCKTLLSISL